MFASTSAPSPPPFPRGDSYASVQTGAPQPASSFGDNSQFASLQTTGNSVFIPAAVYKQKQLRVNDGDTYSSLARQYYSDESYADALKQWNIKEGDTAEQRAGLLPPGGLVFIPDKKEQLDARFPRTGRLQYRVGPGNEEFPFAIAKKTLNNGDNWGQIASLNGIVDGVHPIPAGTILQMPAGAVVPPENKP